MGDINGFSATRAVGRFLVMAKNVSACKISGSCGKSGPDLGTL